MHTHKKSQSSSIASYGISSLLRVGISAQCANLHHPQISHLSPPLVHTSAAHLLPHPDPEVQTPAQSSCSKLQAKQQVGRHGATGTHRNELLAVSGVQVTPCLEEWCLSSAQLNASPHDELKLLLPPASCAELVFTRVICLSVLQLQDHSHCEALLAADQSFPGCSLCPLCLSFSLRDSEKNLALSFSQLPIR